MSQSTNPKTFLSYAWTDKSLARRVARRLRHRGLDVWLDESQLHPSDALPNRIREAIKSSTHLLVLLTSASVKSNWVAREIEIAREQTPPIAVVPIRGETAVLSPLFDEVLGIDVSETAFVEMSLDDLACSIGSGNIVTAARAPEAITVRAQAGCAWRQWCLGRRTPRCP